MGLRWDYGGATTPGLSKEQDVLLGQTPREQQTHPAALAIDSGKVAGGMEAKHDWTEELTTAETIFRRHGPGPGLEPKRPILIPRVRSCEVVDITPQPECGGHSEKSLNGERRATVGGT